MGRTSQVVRRGRVKTRKRFIVIVIRTGHQDKKTRPHGYSPRDTGSRPTLGVDELDARTTVLPTHYSPPGTIYLPSSFHPEILSKCINSPLPAATPPAALTLNLIPLSIVTSTTRGVSLLIFSDRTCAASS